MKPSIAVIGAGLAGLTLARELAGQAEVTLFEKARGLGGRMSTRRQDDRQWDHGAQFFTARSRAFRQLLAPHIAAGTVAEWHPNLTTLSPDKPPFKRPWFEPHYVAVPGMNALLKAMAAGQEVRLQTRVAHLRRRPDGWQLFDEQDGDLGTFDRVVSSAPLPQTRELLGPHLAEPDALAPYAMAPCYALLLAVDAAALPAWDAARVNHAPLRWIAFNHRLPGRGPAGSVVAHSTPEWAREHLEHDQDWVQQQLTESFLALTGLPARAIAGARLHRWRYALSNEPAEPGEGYVLDPQTGLAACGDWCLGGRVEAAFLSGRALARALSRRP